MKRHLWKQLGIAIALAGVLAGTLAAQQPAAPAFEAVSIRVVPPNSPPVMRDMGFTPILPGGQFIDSRIPLLFMIDFAYGVKSDGQLLGLPNWGRTQSYSVSAKPGENFPTLTPAENVEQVRLMMRAMVADRFHLQLHTEARQEKIFHMEVAKGGIRVKEVAPPVPPAKSVPVSAAMGDDGGHMVGSKSTMTSMAGVLTMFLKRPVTDETNLKGYYDFDIRWKPLETPGQPPSGVAFGTEGMGMLIGNLQSQFGLRLTNATGPVEYWVIDHVEPPTDN